VQGRVQGRAKRKRARDRKFDNGETVLRIFRNLFERAREEGRPVTEAGKVAGLGTAVYMALAGLELEVEPTPEVWDEALRSTVEQMAGKLTSEEMQVALGVALAAAQEGAKGAS